MAWAPEAMGSFAIYSAGELNTLLSYRRVVCAAKNSGGLSTGSLPFSPSCYSSCKDHRDCLRG